MDDYYSQSDTVEFCQKQSHLVTYSIRCPHIVDPGFYPPVVEINNEGMKIDEDTTSEWGSNPLY